VRSGDVAIEVEGLVVRYGEHTAVDGLSFTTERGSVTAVLGPNGAGKTSTIETLEGYRRPDGGAVRVLGLDPVVDHTRLVERMGVMLQSGGIYTGIRPLEVLRLFASYYADPVDPGELLELVGLSDRVRSTWRTLSGGEQQRLSLALALVGRPEVVFLDEPTSGVDPSGRQVIRRIMTDLRDRGVTVLLTSHDLDEVERLADHVVIIDHGVVLAEGAPAELARSQDGDVIRFGAPTGLEVEDLGRRLGASVTEPSPGQYVVEAIGSPTTIAALTAWLAENDLPLDDLRVGRQRLEDVFLRLTESTSDTTASTASVGRRRRSRR